MPLSGLYEINVPVLHFAGYVAELVANWFIGSGIPLSIIKRLLTEQDALRKKKEQMNMEVIEEEEETLMGVDEVPPPVEKPENELHNYREIFGMYMN